MWFPCQGHQKQQCSIMALTIPPTCSNLVLCISVMNQKEPQIKKMESFTLHSPAPLLGFRFFVFSYTIGENTNTSLECSLATFTLDPKLNPLPGWSQSCLQLFLNGPLHFCQGSGWEPDWEMCSPCQGYGKPTMSSQAPDPTPNFSKLAQVRKC